MPRVSVMIPAYNYARFLPACITSALDQDGVDLDVLVVNDGSTDDTAAIARAFADRDPRVRLLDRAKNKGYSRRRTRASTLSTASTSSSWTPTTCCLPARWPGRRGCSTHTLRSAWSRAGRSTSATGRRRASRCGARATRSGPATTGSRPGAAAGYSRHQQPRGGHAGLRDAPGGAPHRAELPHTSDFLLWLQMASLADVARVNGPAQGYYRVHSQSLTRTVHADVLFDLRQRADAFTAVFAGPAGRFADADALHDRARRTLAAQALDRACRAFDRGRTGEVPVGGLVDLALELWPGARLLPQWRALQRRERIGPERAPYYPPFIARAVARRASEELARWRWERTGQWERNGAPELSGRRVQPKPLDHRPVVSVVIPCYNYGHYLTGAVASVLDQPGIDGRRRGHRRRLPRRQR